MPAVAWLIFILAAALEVAGDALIRRGIRGGGILFCIIGFVALGSYGLVVNSVRWDFSKLLGVYVAVFAVIGVLAGRFVFAERIPWTTWAGVGGIVAGGVLIQFGNYR